MDILLIFAKNPVPGQVKTRLARTVGDEKAVEIYRFLLQKTRQVALETPMDRRWLFYASGIPEEDDIWPSSAFEKFAQCPGDLGERMADAFERAFAAGGKHVIIIGSDCPELTVEILGEAFAALDICDTIIGPARDGGYYMLGMRRFIPELFQGIAWSTPTVLEQTFAVFEQLRLNYSVFPTLSDIDTEADWLAYRVRSHS
ncbi:MAG: TIGR04282 family arsenosugar biosynthesis glycosyltransferase [Saprospiraceae bacterium]|nr:TIGR04282 family arsenosugar biosynthesis glycosyltransferase [Saprospiraceae bacterium]MDW8230950.1 TIGR04282 family arsenosugar biosynthesis glycosyltransferase [Saprospiraceae bacterium]